MPHSGEGVGAIMSSYQKELEKYRDIDEDEILRTLSPEELEQLDCELQEMDPEVGAPAQGTRSSLQAFGKGEGPWAAKTRAAYRAWSPKGAREKVSVDALGTPGGTPDQRSGLTCSPKLIPKNMLLPAGLRQRDQTKKSPTGPLDRDALLQYLEQQALEVKERDDLVPFTGEKKGTETLTTMPTKTQMVVSQVYPLQLPSHLPALSCPGTRPP